MLDGSVEPSEPKIVRDPMPSNPFRDLWKYLVIAWLGAITPMVFVALIELAHRRSPWDSRIRAGLSLMLVPLPVMCLWFYGRVSVSSSIALRAGMVVPLLAVVVYSTMCIREKKWISSALFLLSSATIGVYFLPVLTHL